MPDTAQQHLPIPEAIRLHIPDWLREHAKGLPARLATLEDRMRLVLDLAGRNERQGTGGPFAAAVFNARTGEIYAAGVNLVLYSMCSPFHAEIVAILLAQTRLGHYDLALDADRSLELVTSTEPCLMCLGAVIWSGVRHLVCGARDADARAIGFDEGPKPAGWRDELTARGIRVTRDVLRQEAADLLREYAARGGVIYNPRR